jgi:uncharacterized protein YjaZ
MITIKIESGKKLAKLEKTVKRIIDSEIEQVESLMRIPVDVDIVVDDDVSRVIPEVGLGGYSVSPNLLYIHINPKFKGIAKTLDTSLRSTLAHEMNHCVRSFLRGTEKTLLEAIVSEGLADHFDIEVNGGEPKLWDTSVKPSQLPAIKKKIKPELNKEEYDNALWFFGANEKSVPRWAGYSLGFYAVGEYMKTSGKPASKLVGEDAKKFLRFF